jgi:hypothetical protein
MGALMVRGRRLAYACILLSLAGATPSAAESTAGNCGNRAPSEAALEQKITSLRSLEKVRQWERRLPDNVHMAAIPAKADVAHDAECYTEITLYEMHPDHMTLWHAFLLGERLALIENPDGDWVPVNSYEHW